MNVTVDPAIRVSQVPAVVGRSRSQIYEDVARGIFPHPFRVGVRSVAVLASEVSALIAARAAGADEATLRALVVRLEQARRQRFEKLTGEAAA